MPMATLLSPRPRRLASQCIEVLSQSPLLLRDANAPDTGLDRSTCATALLCTGHTGSRLLVKRLELTDCHTSNRMMMPLPHQLSKTL